MWKFWGNESIRSYFYNLTVFDILTASELAGMTMLQH